MYPCQCRFKRISAVLQRLTLLVGHRRLEDPERAAASENARQRQRDPVFLVVRGDRNDSRLIPQHDLRNARARHPDTVLTGSNAFDYGNVGVPDLPLDFMAKLVPVLPRYSLQ